MNEGRLVAPLEQLAETILGLYPTLSGTEQRISLALYRMLSQGDPVAVKTLAAASEVTPGEVHASGIEPSERNPVAVSLLAPDPAAAKADIVASFCRYVHFFSSASAAERWCARTPGAVAATLDAAWQLGQRRNVIIHSDALRDRR